MLIEIPGRMIGDYARDETWTYISGRDLEGYKKALEMALKASSSTNPNGEEAIQQVYDAVKAGLILSCPSTYALIALVEGHIRFFNLASRVTTADLYNKLRYMNGPVVITWKHYLTRHEVSPTTEEDVKRMAKEFPRYVKSSA